jgi:hypothetical protein
MIGIFWLIPVVGDIFLLAHRLTLDVAETYDDFLTCPLSHIDAWEATKRGDRLLTLLDMPIRAIIATSEYEEWPRGRVVFERPAQRFTVCADRQAFTYAEQIREMFNLPDDAVFRTDLHYRNTKHLPQKRYLQLSMLLIGN